MGVDHGDLTNFRYPRLPKVWCTHHHSHRKEHDMAIRKTVEEEFIVNGDKDVWFRNCTTALDTGGFKDIRENTTLSQIEAKFKT